MVWIEIWESGYLGSLILVTTRAVVWIEIALIVEAAIPYGGHHPCGGVD